MQTVDIASVTDGTSVTILVGEVLPSADSDNHLWTTPGALAGTTVPLGWDTESGDPRKASVVSQRKHAELAGADAYGTGQNRLEHRLQSVRR